MDLKRIGLVIEVFLYLESIINLRTAIGTRALKLSIYS